MGELLLLAAGLSALTFCVHTFAGQRLVVGPLQAQPFAPFVKATLFVVWHMVTWTLAIVLPQWILLGPIALFAGAGAFAGALPSGQAARCVAAGLMVAIALVHVAWAFGARWPARDRQSLGLAILGRTVVPTAVPCLLVAVALSGMAVVTLGAGPPVARMLIAAVFVARGTFGFVERWIRVEIRGTPYEKYSAFMYTPLALGIGVATFLGR